MLDLVTVIVPVYNVENFVQECLVSILRQTYSKLEIIIVNDGSTDNSFKECQLATVNDSRVLYIDKEVNGGLSDARNRALDVASGAYIAFVDADDFIDSTYIEVLYRQIERNGADIAIVNKYPVTGVGTNRVISGDGSVTIYNSREILAEINKNQNLSTTLDMATTKLYKREVFIDLRFPVGKKYEDAFTVYKAYIKVDKIIYINYYLYAYRFRKGSITHSEYNLSNLDVIEMYEERLIYLQKHKFDTVLTTFHYCSRLVSERIMLKKYYPHHDKIEFLKNRFDQLYNEIISHVGWQYKIKLVLLKYVPIVKVIKQKFWNSNKNIVKY